METGRWVLQAAPTGFSAVFTPDGDLVERTAVSEAAVIHQTVELREGRTIATRVGSWPMLVVGVLMLGAAWLPDAAGRVRPSRSDVDDDGDGSVVHE